MLTKEKAQAFTSEWIEAFNSHDLETIMMHYADGIIFHSPFIVLLNFNGEGIIKNKTDLARYFELGLKIYPDLHFQLHQCFVGVNSLVIHYTSVNEKLAAEMFQLNEEGKAIQVFCHYL